MTDTPAAGGPLHYLRRLYRRLRERMRGGQAIDAGEFDLMMREARAHAGGMARAAQRMAAEAAAQPHTTLMIAVYPNAEAAQALAIAGGEAPEDLHLTLCICGEVANLGGAGISDILAAVRAVAAENTPLSGRVGGMGRFCGTEEGGGDCIYAVPDVVGLADLHDDLIVALAEMGHLDTRPHPFTPHITLLYADAGAPWPASSIEAIPLRFDSISVVVGEQRLDLPLTAACDPDAAVGVELEDAELEDERPAEWAELSSSQRSNLLARAIVAAQGGEVSISDVFDDAVIYSVPPNYVALYRRAYSVVEGRIELEPAVQVELETEYHPARELAELCADGGGSRLFMEVRFAEAPDWIPYLPRPGCYRHPQYGEIQITADRNARFVQNYSASVYQSELPIDAEHQTKLSGATGWIVGMRQNGDGSVDAQVRWTDRGRALLAADRYRYFSPEWYDAWQDPATGQTHQDVAIGGALTTRPFFKDPALRPLVASEFITPVPQEDLPVSTPTTPDPQAFAQLQATNATLKQTVEQQTQTLKQMSEQLGQLQAERRTGRLQAMISGDADAPRWFGEPAKHLEILESLARVFGEDSKEIQSYAAQQRALAEQLNSARLFGEFGASGTGEATSGTTSAWQRIETEAKKIQAAENMSEEQAIAAVIDRNPKLYAEYRNAQRQDTKR